MSNDWVSYDPEPDAFEAGMPRLGQKVTARGGMPGMEARGIPEGHKGTVVGYGRGTSADDRYRANVTEAILAGRPLEYEDIDPLMDSEGPLVIWDGQSELDWYPGQAMACFEAVEGPAWVADPNKVRTTEGSATVIRQTSIQRPHVNLLTSAMESTEQLDGETSVIVDTPYGEFAITGVRLEEDLATVLVIEATVRVMDGVLH